MNLHTECSGIATLKPLKSYSIWILSHIKFMRDKLRDLDSFLKNGAEVFDGKYVPATNFYVTL